MTRFDARKAKIDAHRIGCEIGSTILAVIAEKAQELCRCPFNAQGFLTDEGMEVAIDTVRELIGEWGGEMFSGITQELLNTFRPTALGDENDHLCQRDANAQRD